jgi:hypothetical protein
MRVRLRARAGAPPEAPWGALRGLATACRQDGVPASVVSDRGGASPAHACEAVWTRRPSRHEPLVSTPGARDLHGLDTPVPMQRRRDDDQGAWARPPAALAARQQAFLQTSNTTAPHRLLQARRLPPLPVTGLGPAPGRRDPPADLARDGAPAVCPRTTHRSGDGPWPRDHGSVEAGLPQTPVRLGESGAP